MQKIPSSEITPEHLYRSRRKFIRNAAITAAAAAFLAACGIKAVQTPAVSPSTESTGASAAAPTAAPSVTPAGTQTPVPAAVAEARWNAREDPLTVYESITGFTNYYEFSTDKFEVTELAADFPTDPWSVEVGGLVSNPRTFTLEDLLGFEQEERIYRLRCVETWSMVVPWTGFPLAKLLQAVQPTAEAKYVAFTTALKTDQMIGARSYPYPWPYREGLRLDEAMHDLTILATGLYGKPLPPQNGAPVRLVVPWKYGFKSIKSIIKIDLVSEMPKSFWSAIAPNEYGFYANVNPNVPHPRWSQANERRVGEEDQRLTLMFNGYEEEVAHLYEGMNLTEWY